MNMWMAAGVIDVHGYAVTQEFLRTGGHILYRGVRARDHCPVLLKVPAHASAREREGELLEREFELLRQLDAAGIPRVHSVVRGPGPPCLVLEDSGLTPLRDLIQDGPLDLPRFFRVAIQLAMILDELHRHDVLCGIVSPAAIALDAEAVRTQLLDFSYAMRLADVRACVPPGGPAIAYMAPEQTGRINRAIDHRADFYSLGAALYELLTGSPPFRSADPLELVHSHIARTPVAPADHTAAVPAQLSRIVMRLLAKAAEDRYQTAAGLVHDLERCQRQWSASSTIDTFEPGERDISDRFLIPQRLYGRDRELAELLRIFDEASSGSKALLLVSGYSGIGKTAFINELYRPIVRQRGYFTSGKCDQVVRSIPYGAVIQAFRGLVWQMLAEREDRLAQWRARLTTALGSTGSVLAEVIPEIQVVIGEQPASPPLDPAEAQNRFRYVFQSFVRTLAQPDHPLVVFLDDLQWVDPATLELLHALLTGPDIGHLLVVGAYRANDVDDDHVLALATRRLEKAGARVERMPLGPLMLSAVTDFLAETLRGEHGPLHSLAQLILRKTDGNPFFVIEFLKAIREQGLFQFDRDRARWSFRLGAIAAADITDNVVDLMTRRIRALSPVAQSVLTLAACIGSPFRWSTFLTVSRRPESEAFAGLAEALEAGLVQPAGATYEGAESASAPAAFAFLHDRVQQAAYGLIPDAQRKPVHLDVGRLLLAEHAGEVPDEHLFEVVNHLNVGRALVTEDAERLAFARLNLAAGRRARLSTAYQAAAAYLDEGILFATAVTGPTDSTLLFALYLTAAECHYLSGGFEEAERCFDLSLAQSRTALERAQVHSLRIVLHENRSRYQDAIASGREGLALFGIALPSDARDTTVALDAEIDRIQALVGERPIASLVDLPAMTDPGIRMVMRILTSLWAPTYLSGAELLTRLISATMVRLSLAYGNTEDSAYGYVTHALTIGPVRRDFNSAYEWGELALAVNERFNDTTRRAKIHQQFHAHVKLWRRPFESCLPHAREARRSGLESGDFTYAGYGAVTESWPAFLVSRSLDQFVRDYTPTLALLERIRMTDFRAALRLILNWALALQGRTAGPLSLSDAQFDEGAFLATYRDSSFFLTFFYTARLHLAVLGGQYEEAVEFARQARGVTIAGTIWPVLVDFWGSLAMAGAYPLASDRARADYRERIAAARASLNALGASCPENFRCWALLVSAAMERIDGRIDRAIDLAGEAARYARSTDNLQHEALAEETCAALHLARGDRSAASTCLLAAHRQYAAWGAAVKARQLEGAYADLFPPDPAARVEAAPARQADDPASLDMATVLKVARAIAGEIEVDQLSRTLLSLALENAGADRGVLLQEREGTTIIEAEAGTASAQIAVRSAAGSDLPGEIPHAIIRYVRRTNQSLVIGNAAADERFAGDPYIARAGARSVLCVPMIHQGRSAGMLYLENSLTTDAFTPARTEMMRILAAQAAISLENARLYEGMKAEVARRTLADASLRDALAEVEALKNQLEAENVYLQEEIRTQHNFNEIVGNSPALLEVLRSVELVAPTESTVLLLGETGSGKELFARAIHGRSRRSGRPLVKVNCGAIAPGLVESELFGHVKGAFTGAIDRRVGRFELANGGTILLDEIGELPLEAQVKLLRVLQEQEFEPVGSGRTVRVNVRVIAATNRDLEAAVRQGTFRADLLYRLDVFPIRIPPLRDRRSDIPLLAGLFVTGLARRLGKPIHGFSTRSMERLMDYSWPGNVRELQNVVERAAILARGPVLEVERPAMSAPPATAEQPVQPDAGATLDAVQRAHIVSVLKTTGGVVEGPKGAASILGLHPNTLRSRMKKLGIVSHPMS